MFRLSFLLYTDELLTATNSNIAILPGY